jgi:hypothetical protein
MKSFFIHEIVLEDKTMTYIEENRRIWDNRSENNDIWSVPVTSEEVERARKGR